MASRGRRQSAHSLRAAMLAGWLFADLLLVLFITAFTSLSAPPSCPRPGTATSASTSAPVPQGCPTPTETAGTPTPTPTKPKPTTTPQPRVLQQNPKTLTITDVSPSDVTSTDAATRTAAVGKLLGELRQKLAAQGLQKRQAGFVIVLAYGADDPSDIDQALSTANSVVGILKAKESQFSGATGVGYWSGSPGFEFKIFFFA